MSDVSKPLVENPHDDRVRNLPPMLTKNNVVLATCSVFFYIDSITSLIVGSYLRSQSLDHPHSRHFSLAASLISPRNQFIDMYSKVTNDLL